MRFVLDDSAVIDFFEARGDVGRWFLKRSRREVGLPAPSLAVLSERAHAEGSETRQRQLRTFLDAIAIVPFGRLEAEKVGELGVWARSAGRSLGFAELAAAATAIAHGAILVTVRSGLFVDIPDLRVDVR
jgi:predicted nucleic acid-binding protein